MGSRTYEFRERLIDEIRQWPALWDVTHPAHKDADEREKCWLKVGEALDVPNKGEMLKHEWKILRDSLRQALRNKRNHQGKTWHFQERMAFLLPHLTQRVKPVKEEYIKPPAETEEPSPSPTETRQPSLDSVELFFASVCVAARRLSANQRQKLQMEVLAALHRAEGGDG